MLSMKTKVLLFLWVLISSTWAKNGGPQKEVNNTKNWCDIVGLPQFLSPICWLIRWIVYIPIFIIFGIPAMVFILIAGFAEYIVAAGASISMIVLFFL